MSIVDKQTFIHSVEKSLGKYFKADDVTTVMKVIAEKINNYNIDPLPIDGGNKESEELLTAFLNAKRIEGRSIKTIERYEYIIKQMYSMVDVSVKNITVFHLRNYLSIKKANGSADSTLDGIRQVLSSYFGWLQKEGLISNNPTVNLNPIRSVKKIRKPYSPIDIEKLKENCSNARDKAIISTLLSTGCRISEICSLNRSDVNFVTMEITVLGKGNKERTVFIDDVTSMLIQRYLSERRDELPALFIGKRLDRLKPGGVRKMLHSVAKKAGVDNTHPHRFRRTLATNLINHGMPIQEVASILGHEKLDTTMKYIYINTTNVKNSYNKYIG